MPDAIDACCLMSQMIKFQEDVLSTGALLHTSRDTADQSRSLGTRSITFATKSIKVPEIIDRETELKPQQLKDYFERIQLPEHLRNERRLGRLDSELLRAIVRGHVSHIPFENLSLVGSQFSLSWRLPFACQGLWA